MLKRYKPEIGTPVIMELFRHQRDTDTLATSSFTWIEATSVLARYARGGILQPDTYRKSLGDLTQDFANSLVVQSITDRIVADAARLAARYAVRAPDALQLAGALAALSSVPEQALIFVCADHRLGSAAKAARLEVLDPEDPSALTSLRRFRT